MVDAPGLVDLDDRHGESDRELGVGAHALHDEVAPVAGVRRDLDRGRLREVDDRRGTFDGATHPIRTAILVVDGQPVGDKGTRAADSRRDRHEPVAIKSTRAPAQPVVPLEWPLRGTRDSATGRVGIGERRVRPTRTRSVGLQAPRGARLHRGDGDCELVVCPKLVLWQARGAVTIVFRHARVDLQDPKRRDTSRDEVVSLARRQQVGALDTATGAVGVVGWYAFVNAQGREAVVLIRRVDLHSGGQRLVL